MSEVTLLNGVEEIGDNVFYCCNSLKSIKLPESLRVIGNYAFDNCVNLENIAIPEGVVTIGNGAFHTCLALTDIEIPESVRSIGDYAFAGCRNLSDVRISHGAETIGESAFDSCDSLNELVIPGSVKIIQEHTFGGWSNLHRVEFLNGVQEIKEYAFSVSGSPDVDLQEVIIPGSVRTIESGVFSGFTGLQSVKLQDGVETIDGYAFSGCTNLTDITIPSSATTIGEEAFKSCSQLSDIDLPKSLTTIDKGAFKGCSSLKEIDIPSGVEAIEDSTFEDCKALENIKISLGIGSIGENAFANCSNLKKAEIPVSVISIGSCAFSGCSALNSVEIPDSVTTIGISAFENCSSLGTIRIPGSVKTIEKIFSGCDSLKTVTLCNGTEKINDDAFRGLTGLESIEIPGSLKVIGENAFRECSALNKIDLVNGMTEIGRYAFSGCSALSSVSLSEGVTSIGSYAFEGCSSLTGIKIPGNVKTVNSYTFSDCSALSNVSLSEGLTAISSYAFQNCSSLESIRIPKSVTEISSSAFSGCSSLKEIVYEGTEEEWNQHFSSLNQNLPGTVEIKFERTAAQGSGNPDTTEYYYGTVDTNSGDRITIDGTEYPYSGWHVRDDYYRDKSVRYRLDANGSVSFIETIEIYEGIISEWNQEYRYLTVGGTKLWITMNTGEEVEERLNAEETLIGRKAKVYCIYNNVISKISFVTTVVKDGTVMFYEDDTLASSRPLSDYCRTRLTISPAAARVDFDNGAVTPSSMEIKVTFSSEWSGDDVIDQALKETYSFQGDEMNISSSSGFTELKGEPDVNTEKNRIAYGDSYTGYYSMTMDSGWEKIKSEYQNLITENVTLEGFFGYYILENGVSKGTDLAQGSCSVKFVNKVLEREAEEQARKEREKAEAEERKRQQEEAERQKKYEEERNKALEEIDEINDSVKNLLEDAIKNKNMYIASSCDLQTYVSISWQTMSRLEQDFLVRALLYSTPQETWTEELEGKLTDELFQKVFGSYKPPVEIGISELTMQYVVETKQYGKQKIQLSCPLNEFCLSGNKFAMFGKINYEILGPAEKNGKNVPQLYRSGMFGEIAWTDCKTFAEACYELAEAELKKAYISAFGRDVDVSAKTILDNTANSIMELLNEDVSDVLWQCMVSPTQNMTIKCPVNVYVYNTEGQLCGSIEEDEVTLESSDFELAVEGETKLIRKLPYGYSVKYVATAAGTMKVEITEYANQNVPVRSVELQEVPLYEGIEYQQQEPEEFLGDTSEYRIVSGLEASWEVEEESFLLQLDGLPDIEIAEFTGWKTGSSCKVRLQLQNTGSGTQTADYYIAAYDENGKFIRALTDRFEIAAKYPAEIVTKTYTFENGSDIDCIRVITLDGGVPAWKSAEYRFSGK